MTGWFFANMAWASLLMLVLLLVRRPFARAFGAGPAYALWLLPAARLVMPPLPAWPAEVSSLIPSQTLILWEEAAAPAPPDGWAGWVPVLLVIWALGAAALIAWQWLAYRRFLADLSLSARTIGVHGALPLVESEAVSGPLALGLLDRRIVVPADFGSRYTSGERRLALDHEAVHHRRGDIWWNHLALVLLALNWFNPIAWIAFRAFRADQELACDAAVTAAASPEERADYAQALVKSASRPGLIAACPLNHAHQLKRRLKMMKDHRRSPLRMIGGTAALALLAGVGLSAGGPGLAQQAEQKQGQPRTDAERRQEHRVIVIDRGGEPTSEGRARSDSSSDGERSVERREHVIVSTGSGGGETVDRRAIRIHGRDGVTLPEECENAEVSQVDESSEGQRTRIVLCSRGGAAQTPAQRAEGLRRARDRIAGDTHLSAEHKTRVLAALDAEIARLGAN